MRPIVIIQHPREKKSKCTLEPLRLRPGYTFYNAHPGFTYDASGHLLLSVNAPELTPDDGILTDLHATKQQKRPLLLLDSTWRLLPQLEGCLTGQPRVRSIGSSVQTAYPRVSKIGADPSGGLASIEALFVALTLLGERDDTVLSDYHWREPFLMQFS